MNNSAAGTFRLMDKATLEAALKQTTVRTECDHRELMLEEKSGYLSGGYICRLCGTRLPPD
jgi:hypothetical protein